MEIIRLLRFNNPTPHPPAGTDALMENGLFRKKAGKKTNIIISPLPNETMPLENALALFLVLAGGGVLLHPWFSRSRVSGTSALFQSFVASLLIFPSLLYAGHALGGIKVSIPSVLLGGALIALAGVYFGKRKAHGMSKK